VSSLCHRNFLCVTYVYVNRRKKWQKRKTVTILSLNKQHINIFTYYKHERAFKNGELCVQHLFKQRCVFKLRRHFNYVQLCDPCMSLSKKNKIHRDQIIKKSVGNIVSSPNYMYMIVCTCMISKLIVRIDQMLSLKSTVCSRVAVYTCIILRV